MTNLLTNYFETKNENLPSPSKEQQKLIKAIENDACVKVMALAGVGKTTGSLLISANLPNKKFLILTYNKDLADDCKKKIQNLKLKNVECRTYHSQIGICATIPGHTPVICNNDTRLLDILEGWKNGNFIKKIDCHCVILDENQDMRPSYYKCVLHMLPDSIQLMTMGDPNQLLYDYGTDDRATSEYLKCSETYFKDKTGAKKWETLHLTKSYRLSPKICTFVNCIWNTNIVHGNDKTDHAVEYWHLKYYSKELLDRLKELLNKHKAEDVAFLTWSLKQIGKEKPIQFLINKLLDEKMNGKRRYNFHVKGSDSDTSSMDNKILVSTFCGSKGLTIPVVVVFGFETFKHPAPTNQMGVALSRAGCKLIVIHGINKEGNPNPYYPPLNSKKLQVLVDNGAVHAPDGIPSDRVHSKENLIPKPLSVTEITHLSAMTVKRLLSRGTFETVRAAGENLRMTKKRKFNTGVLGTEEEFSVLYGVAFPFALEWIKTSAITHIGSILCPILIRKKNSYRLITLIDEFRENNNIYFTEEETQFLNLKFMKYEKANGVKSMSGSDVIDMINTFKYTELQSLKHYGVCDRDKYKHIFSDEITQTIRQVYDKKEKTPSDYMFLANASQAFNGTHELFSQMGTDYTWVDSPTFDAGISDLLEMFKCTENMDFEYSNSYELEQCIQNEHTCYSSVVGRMDMCIDNIPYELKCTSSLTEEHKLQILLYTAIQCIRYEKEGMHGFLINTQTNEIIRVHATIENSIHLIQEAVLAKLS